jgi:hypothetical protein
MSSYTKQMIASAQEWLRANPDPDSAFLSIPGLNKHKPRPKPDLKRYESLAVKVPQIKSYVADLKRLMNEAEIAASELHESEGDLETHVNATPVPSQTKFDSSNDSQGATRGRWSLAWARHGYNVFDLSADFTAAMLLTDPRELDIASVRLPFRGILMIIPAGFAQGAEGGDYTKIHITEIPRTDIRQIGAANEIATILRKQDPAVAQRILDGLINDPGRTLDSQPTSLITATKPDPEDTAIYVYATDGTHVLDTLIERKGLTWDAFDALPDSVDCDRDKEARQTIRQIVFGTLAYASSVESAIEPAVVDRPKRSKGDSEPKAARWDVGRTIRIDPNLVRAARAGSREIALRLKHRHIVRGHYRNQAHGIRRRDRKQIWITPHWKGPVDGAALVHTYVLEQSKEQP